MANTDQEQKCGRCDGFGQIAARRTRKAWPVVGSLLAILALFVALALLVLYVWSGPASRPAVDCSPGAATASHPACHPPPTPR